VSFRKNVRYQAKWPFWKGTGNHVLPVLHSENNGDAFQILFDKSMAFLYSSRQLKDAMRIKYNQTTPVFIRIHGTSAGNAPCFSVPGS